MEQQTRIIDLLPVELHEELLQEAAAILETRKQKVGTMPTQKEIDQIIEKIRK
jgi:hypothetical protein